VGKEKGKSRNEGKGRDSSEAMGEAVHSEKELKPK
jgi:hypothetical protein